MSNKKLTYKNLIIIIIGILILSTILVILFIKVHETIKVEKFIKDMELIEENVSYINSEYVLWENYDPNEAGNFLGYLQSKNFINANSASNIYIDEFEKIIEELNSNSSTNWNSNLDQILSNYCYFTPSSILENFNIQNPDYYIIINFYTGNIICKNGVLKNGKVYYRHYDLKDNLGIISYKSDIIPDVEIVENNGLNKKLKISLGNNENVANIAEIYYFADENEEDKKRCTELADYQYRYEENSAYFTINTSGKMGFIVEDTNYNQYSKVNIDITLCNKPILDSGMQGIYFDEYNNEIMIKNISDKDWYNYSSNNFKPAYAKKEDGSYWVWIPRFTYKEVENNLKIDFVYNISQISTTNKFTINYVLPKIFEKEISGIWVHVKNLNYYNDISTDFFEKYILEK